MGQSYGINLFRPGRSCEFLEARIVPQRIEHWIEPEQSRSERHVCGIKRAFVRCREQFLQGGDGAVGFSHPRRHSGKENPILRLLLEERFQFAARLFPTFLGGSMVTGNFLRPA